MNKIALTLTFLALTPVMAYSAANGPYEQAPQTEEIRDMDCQICLLPDLADKTVDKVVTPCGHYFHQECLDRWLKDQTTCPVCKRVLRAGEAAAYYPDQEEEAQAALQLQQEQLQQAGAHGGQPDVHLAEYHGAQDFGEQAPAAGDKPMVGDAAVHRFIELLFNTPGREPDAQALIDALGGQGAAPGVRNPEVDRLVENLIGAGRLDYAMEVIEAVGN